MFCSYRSIYVESSGTVPCMFCPYRSINVCRVEWYGALYVQSLSEYLCRVEWFGTCKGPVCRTGYSGWLPIQVKYLVHSLLPKHQVQTLYPIMLKDFDFLLFLLRRQSESFNMETTTDAPTILRVEKYRGSHNYCPISSFELQQRIGQRLLDARQISIKIAKT